MSKKIGVRKAMQPQIDSSGKLSYVMDVGGRREEVDLQSESE